MTRHRFAGTMKAVALILVLTRAAIALAGAGTVKQDPLLFTTGNADYKIATAARPSVPEVETGDDFVIAKAVSITGAKFQGTIPPRALCLHPQTCRDQTCPQAIVSLVASSLIVWCHTRLVCHKELNKARVMR